MKKLLLLLGVLCLSLSISAQLTKPVDPFPQFPKDGVALYFVGDVATATYTLPAGYTDIWLSEIQNYMYLSVKDIRGKTIYLTAYRQAWIDAGSPDKHLNQSVFDTQGRQHTFTIYFVDAQEVVTREPDL
ncbi:MAG: hypothetical protein LUF85_02360 [Bacteroides sp.]|nr:hypothetical protein [Bacteroides sp.]